jgi:DNA ligase-1
LALLLGSTFLPGVLAAVQANAPALQATSELPPALMLARLWPAGQDPSGFLVSEKLDGVRAFWDGHSLRFRSGRAIAAPLWFTVALPRTPLDGELWLGRGRFDELSGMVRRLSPLDSEWQQMRFMIFDLPGEAGAFAERSARLLSLVSEVKQPWLQAVEQQRLSGITALQDRLAQIVGDGGEGLVLHRANALWLPGRSEALFKLKPVPDEDARVGRPPPRQRPQPGATGRLAARNARWPALCPGHWFYRCPACRAAAGGDAGELPLP